MKEISIFWVCVVVVAIIFYSVVYHQIIVAIHKITF